MPGGQGRPLCTWLPQGLGFYLLNAPLHGQEAWKLLVPETPPVWLSSEEDPEPAVDWGGEGQLLCLRGGSK